MDVNKDKDDPKLSELGVALAREVQVQQGYREFESNDACLLRHDYI
jgi:hypothetical protein